MCSETCINRSCSKAETLVRRTDMFDPVCFLYTSLSKAKTAKWDLPQTDNFFQSSHKKSACLTRTQLKILGISKKQRIKLDIFSIFSKRNIVLHFKTAIFVCFHFAVLNECDTFESNSESFFPSFSLHPTNSCFASLKAISDRCLQTIPHPSIYYWFHYCDLH